MALASFTTEVADLPPCGPDLEAADDPAFLDYYYEAEARLPERYFTPGYAADGSDDQIFDPKSIDLAAESAQIAQLSERSRDLRLMSLLARFQVLAGRLGDFVVTVQGMAGALAQWSDALHPQLLQGSSDRRGAIEALNVQASAVMPLLHLTLLPGTELTLRRYMVSLGRADPRASEADLVGADLLGPLRDKAHEAAVNSLHARSTALAEALAQLAALSAAHGARAFRPDLAAIRKAVADLQEMIAAARPELSVWSDKSAALAAPDLPQTPDAPAPTLLAQSKVAALAVGDRDQARAALDAAISWLYRREPSSPVLLLLLQARDLVGVSLVQALEALIPHQAGQAVLQIGQNTGFALPMDRLRALSERVAADSPPQPTHKPEPPTLRQRSDLVALILGVESYYLRYEPASPVPLLLVKAREMMDKRFDAIVSELMASPPQGHG